MKIVIDIPEYVYETVFASDGYIADCDSNEKVGMAIKNGTPLPKGHGRILDEKDILDTENNDGGWYDLTDMPEYIAGVKAIIEAESEES